MSVVWEWKNGFGFWLPYSAEVSSFLENIQTKKLTFAQLGDIDPKLSKYTINLSDFLEHTEGSDVIRLVRRSVYDDNIVSKELCWQWADTNAETWHFYEIEVQNYIENSFQKQRNLELNIEEKFSHLAYIINFQALTQTSKTTGYTRSIRRIVGNVYPKVKTRITRSASSLPAGNSQVEITSKSRKSRSKRTGSTSSLSEEVNTETNMCSTSSCPGPSNQKSGKHQLLQSPSNSSRKKRSNADGNEEKSLFKSLTSSARLLASFFTSSSNKNSKRKSKRKSDDGLYMPFPIFNDSISEKPVPGVKLPSEITLVNVIDGKSVLEVFDEYTSPAIVLPDDDDCSICCCSLKDPSYFEEGGDAVVELKSCSHKFHKSCVSAMYNSSNKVGYLQCPTCKIIYGVKVGNQPPGQINYGVLPSSVPGYPDCETIVITYYIPHGVQGSDHPQPNMPFTARGFPRRCYLPDNEEGRKVMKLLVTAWERRLIFTIGQSSTTGENCTVTWNEIHHKTEFGSNYSGHGYPDPLYLQNVLQELALQGVTEDSIE